MEEKNRQVENLKLKCEGIQLEYQYVSELKERKIAELSNKYNQMESFYEGQIKELEIDLQKYKNENESIKNSRWWKLREKIKGVNNA